MKKAFVILLGVCAAMLTKAQRPAALNGVVVETTTKGNIEPIQGAMLHWLGNAKQAAITDSLGVFQIPLNAKSNRLIVQALGFKNDTVLVNGGNNLRILMISKRIFDDAIITYEKKSSEISFIDPWKTTIMNEKELFKAACCNLSESFETNPSVDVAYTDAITGSKQIQMLGLAGQYTQMSVEQMPGIRGIATNFGLNYLPGTWINSIQVSKGMGSVVNGFESVSGQINVELHKPIVKDKLLFNAYGSQGGRYETNLVMSQQPSKMFSHALFLHGSTLIQRMDQNKDGYLDNPLGSQGNVLYRFSLDKKTGFVLHGSVQYLNDKKIGGQINFEENMQDTANNKLFGTRIQAERTSGFLRVGYLFPGSKYRSIGLQLNGSVQTYDNFFGNNLYTGKQKSGYANLIFQDIIGNPNHKVRAGLSQQLDEVNENLFNKTAYVFQRTENVMGAFAEYTYTYRTLFTMVAGARVDHHNYFGNYFVPRLHLRYAPLASTVFRASAGKGWKTANLLSENLGTLNSNRTWIFTNPLLPKTAYGFAPEEAWNYGINLTHEFKLNYHRGTLSADYYFTQFAKQVVVDRDANAQQVVFYQLSGLSYSRSFQVQLDYQPFKRFDVRLAYRWFEVKTQYNQNLLQVPFIAPHRGFLNLSYTTKNKWNFDATGNWVGKKRLPQTLSNPENLRALAESSPFWLLNVQVSKSFKKKLDVYVGCENLLNFQQPNAILDPTNPYGKYFDASLIWGPVFGRMVYGGLRYRL